MLSFRGTQNRAHALSSSRDSTSEDGGWLQGSVCRRQNLGNAQRWEHGYRKFTKRLGWNASGEQGFKMNLVDTFKEMEYYNVK